MMRELMEHTMLLSIRDGAVHIDGFVCPDAGADRPCALWADETGEATMDACFWEHEDGAMNFIDDLGHLDFLEDFSCDSLEVQVLPRTDGTGYPTKVEHP